MSEEKICPFMSRCEIQPNGDHIIATAYCQGERCMAWISERTQVIQPPEGYFGETREIHHSGYCRLIFNTNSWRLVGDVEGCRLIP